MDKKCLHNFGDEKKVRKSMFLSPKADITFKKVFGEHPDIVKSFLNPNRSLGKLGFVRKGEIL